MGKLAKIIKICWGQFRKFINPIKYYRSLGVSIGERVIFTGSPSWGSEPWLIHIGNDVLITNNVSFHTHDGMVHSLVRLDPKYKDIVKFGKIVIEDHCSIGAGARIMPNVCIGEGSIIAAGAIVTKDIPPHSVAAGIPTKVICSVEEMAEKWLKSTPEYNIELLEKNLKQGSIYIAEKNWERTHLT